MRDYFAERGLALEDLCTRAEMRRRIPALGQDWYVYSLWRMDRNEPFYVGMGRWHRVTQHEMPSALRREDLPRTRLISVLKSAGVEIRYLLEDNGLTEPEALDREAEWIRKYGRADRGLGPLVNRSDGYGNRNPGWVRAVVVNGVEYVSMTAAAQATGSPTQSIRFRIKVGYPGYYYVDEGQRPRRPRKPRLTPSVGTPGRAVVVRGETYPSMSAAEAATGLSVPLLRYRIRCGWAGYYYVEEGQRPGGRKYRTSRP